MRQLFSWALSFLCLLGIGLLLSSCQQQPKTESGAKKIGVIIPLEHKAMDEIVAGFTETLKKSMPNTKLEFKIANAQGDLNIERAIIQQMNSGSYDLVVPVGITATQMALSMIHEKPIIGLAAHYTEEERSTLKNCNITAVHDEIPPQQTIAFIHQVYPQLKNLTLIHSSEDKVFPQIKEAVASGEALGITVKPLLVPAMTELYSIAKAIPQDTEALFVLKDHTIASGISTLAMVANDKQLPLVTSDQDSVSIGGGFAVGVFERDIGVAGAAIAKEILDGQAVCTIPIVNMKELKVFINPKMLSLEGQSVQLVTDAAKRNGFQVAMVGPKEEQVAENLSSLRVEPPDLAAQDSKDNELDTDDV